jgi:hypothetical protein
MDDHAGRAGPVPTPGCLNRSVVLGGVALVGAFLLFLGSFSHGSCRGEPFAPLGSYCRAGDLSASHVYGWGAIGILVLGFAGGVVMGAGRGSLKIFVPVLVAGSLVVAMTAESLVHGGSTSGSQQTALTTSLPTPAHSRTIVITPATGLRDGQVVHVVATGYTAHRDYFVVECVDKGSNTASQYCDLAGVKDAKADSKGMVTSDYVLTRGPFGPDKIVCGLSQRCLISVGGSSDPSEVATAYIAFA